MDTRHGITHIHRPGHRNRATWTCECGAHGRAHTITTSYRQAARHIETATGRDGTTVPTTHLSPATLR